MSQNTKNETPLEKIVLGEIAGKNSAVHAYDSITWKIRTGFLTLLFLGWGILLKGLAENSLQPAEAMNTVVIAMFLFSCGVTLAGWLIDRSYLRPKFRVILALNLLMDSVFQYGGEFKNVPVDTLKVAGDNPDRSYQCKGYTEAMRISVYVFFIPFFTVAVATYFIIR